MCETNLGRRSPRDTASACKIENRQERSRAGGDDVCPIFGDDRSKSPHPMHACPGFEMGFGILLAIVYGVVEHQAITGGLRPYRNLNV
jgi:hypothetical protein